MCHRPGHAVSFALVWLVSSAHASPMTYDFSGTLNQPYNGSSQFSGSFTLGDAPSQFAQWPMITGYEPASASVSIGGQNYNFQNTMINDGNGLPQYPADQPPNVWYLFQHTIDGTVGQFQMQASNGVNTGTVPIPGAVMGINLGSSLSPVIVGGNYRFPLDLNQFSLREFGFWPGYLAPTASPGTVAQVENGTITNIQAVPEPSSLVFAAIVGLGLVLRQRAYRRLS